MIRKLGVCDAEFVLELTRDPTFIRNISDRGLRDIAAAEFFICEGPWTNGQPRGFGQFAMELIETGEVVGICGLLHRESLNLFDVGFAVLPHYWRQGYAFEAADAMMSYGRQKLGLKEIVGLTSPGNSASIGLLEKLGMRFIKTIGMSDDDPGTSLYG
ncbi:MAG: GNAT family N-acetyltransferase [Planctomycetes bacterium]|nr:GNAT family N-acetyltransferase [Planctomycetota bacterium]